MKKDDKKDETAELKDEELEQASGGDVWAKGHYAYLGSFSR